MRPEKFCQFLRSVYPFFARCRSECDCFIFYTSLGCIDLYPAIFRKLFYYTSFYYRSIAFLKTKLNDHRNLFDSNFIYQQKHLVFFENYF